MAYGIKSEANLINLIVINSGCDTINAAAQHFVTCGNKIVEASTVCNSEVLSIDGLSFEPVIKELGESIKKLQGYVEDYTAEIRARASQIYNEQYNELQEYKKTIADNVGKV